MGRVAELCPLGGMTRSASYHSVRLVIAVVLMLLSASGPPYGQDELGATSIWSQFWLGCFSAAAVTTLVPVLFFGRIWQRVVAGVLGVIPALGLSWALMYLFIM